MPRVTIDIHDNRDEAWSSLAALREVGLNAGDIASVWLAPTDETEAGENDAASPTPFAVHTMKFTDIGTAQVTGWIADLATQAFDKDRHASLGDVLGKADIGAKETERARAALLGGAGLVAVRARDGLSQA